MKPAAKRERFDSFRLDHAAEQVSRAFAPDFLRLKPERARQKALLEQSAHRDRHPALEPQRQQAATAPA